MIQTERLFEWLTFRLRKHKLLICRMINWETVKKKTLLRHQANNNKNTILSDQKTVYLIVHVSLTWRRIRENCIHLKQKLHMRKRVTLEKITTDSAMARIWLSIWIICWCLSVSLCLSVCFVERLIHPTQSIYAGQTSLRLHGCGPHLHTVK